MRVVKVLAATLMVAAVLAMTAPSFGQGRGPGGPGQGGPQGGGFQGGRGPQGGPQGGRGQGGPGMMMGGGPGMMMMGGQFGEELGITEEQREQMTAAMQEMGEKMRAARDAGEDLSQEERMAQFTEMREAMQQKIESILTPEQVARSGQLRLQMEGTRALGREEVQDDLGMTDEQKAQLEAINERVRNGFQELGQAMRDADEDERAELREKMGALRERSEQAQMSVLTDEQKSKFEEMKGEPFEFQRPEPGQGRQGGPRGGQGGNFQYERGPRETPTTEGRNTGAFPRGPRGGNE